MAFLRFTTAHEVLEAFPTARGDIGRDIADGEPLGCLEALAAGGTPDAALAFCAYLLPRREAVRWACRCARILLPTLAGEDDPGLAAAEAWVRKPDDGNRRAALHLALNSDLTLPTPWLALGAGWAGGSMTAGEHPVQAPPHLTAKAVRAALLLCLAQADPKLRAQNLRACVDIGRRLAEGDDAS